MNKKTQSDVAKSNKLKLFWGFFSLITPTALIIATLLIYTVVNFAVAASAPEPTPCPTGPDSIMMGVCAGSNVNDQSDLFGEQTTFRTVSNVILFVIGAISFATWLPGIIVGIVLLASRKKATSW